MSLTACFLCPGVDAEFGQVCLEAQNKQPIKFSPCGLRNLVTYPTKQDQSIAFPVDNISYGFMPRIPPILIQRAARLHPYLAKLIHECRDLESAHNELRWLREHALAVSCREEHGKTRSKTRSRGWRWHLDSYVKQRAKGKPLQYILGSQPFGRLDIICRPGVLIPRPETEDYICRVADLVKNCLYHASAMTATGTGSKDALLQDKTKLRLLDVCTGSGAIALLMYDLLSQNLRHSKLSVNVEVLGIDKHKKPLRLARENLHRYTELAIEEDPRRCIKFKAADLFDLVEAGSDLGPYDILISNPPYISRAAFDDGTTSRSVRKHEPIAALVPELGDSPTGLKASGDVFYPHLLDLSLRVGAQLTVLEVGNTDQANRVSAMVQQTIQQRALTNSLVEIWEDQSQDTTSVGVDKDKGNGRAVVWWQGNWARWRMSVAEHKDWA